MSSSRLLLKLASAASNRQSVAASQSTSSRWAGVSGRRCFSQQIVRKQVSKEERAALRLARREQAAHVLQQQQVSGEGGTSGSGGNSRLFASKWIWYAAVAVPASLLVWGSSDENSPPAKFSEMIGLTGFIRSFTDEIAKPSHNKLLPDWSQVRSIFSRWIPAVLSFTQFESLTDNTNYNTYTTLADAKCAP
jgi:hypothetical protein